jgi:hypothetical protein
MAVELDLSGPERKLRDLGRALRSVEDGKQLRKDLIKNIKAALKPSADEAKSSIKSMSSTGVRRGGLSLRGEVARRVVVETRLSGRSVGARVRAKKTPRVRGFDSAPKKLNRPGGWRHPWFGERAWWFPQMGKPDWFDGPMRAGKSRYRKGVLDAMENTAREIARRVR